MQVRIRREAGIRSARDKSSSHRRALRGTGVKNLLGIIAAVLIVLWLLGFLAFHVSSGVIHAPSNRYRDVPRTFLPGQTSNILKDWIHAKRHSLIRVND
jgi:hypothetical protein